MWPIARAIRDPQGFKLIQVYEGTHNVWRDELYRLDLDPDESLDLLSEKIDPESRRAHLRLREQLETIAATGWSPHGGALTSTR